MIFSGPTAAIGPNPPVVKPKSNFPAHLRQIYIHTLTHGNKIFCERVEWAWEPTYRITIIDKDMPVDRFYYDDMILGNKRIEKYIIKVYILTGDTALEIETKSNNMKNKWRV